MFEPSIRIEDRSLNIDVDARVSIWVLALFSVLTEDQKVTVATRAQEMQRTRIF